MPTPSLLQRLKERKLVQWGQPNLAKPQGSLPEKKTLRQKLTETLKSGHIHISLATGISILVMAYASSRILPEPMPYLHLAAPPFLMTIYEALVSKKKYERYTKSLYWVVGIVAATLIVIGAKLV